MSRSRVAIIRRKLSTNQYWNDPSWRLFAVLAVVSGRRIDDLRARVGLGDGVFYIGLHGLEIEGPRFARRTPTAARRSLRRIDDIAAAFRRSATAPGIRVENKEAGCRPAHTGSEPGRRRLGQAARAACGRGSCGYRPAAGLPRELRVRTRGERPRTARYGDQRRGGNLSAVGSDSLS